MKINGEKLAWAMIHFAFFLSFVFIDSNIDWESANALIYVIFYFAMWVWFGRRFIVNMGEAFE